MRNLEVIVALSLFLISCGGGNDKVDTKNNDQVSIIGEKRKVSSEVVGLGRVVPEGKILSIRPEVAGRLKLLHIEMNDSVEAGEVLFEINHEVQDAQIKHAEASIATQRKMVNVVTKQVEKTKTNLHFQQQEYERLKNAFQNGAITKQKLDNQENLYRQAKDDLSITEAQLDRSKAQLRELQANLTVARAQREKFLLRAPADGLMLSVELPEGSFVTSNSLLGKFAPASSTDVEVQIDELFAELVEVGQKAYISPEGKPDTLALAEVIRVASFLDKKSIFSDEVGTLEDRRVRKVKVRITKEFQPMLIGSRVECIIKVK